ncbi:MAG TPA: alpha/beta hydrolase [Dongiaceae bacterium]|nr:alpha/beta hydrolase [Dongiaceae bacterium]
MTDVSHRYALATSHGWVAVAESGRGKLPLLLIHGNSTSGEVFKHQMTGPLALDHHLIAIDLPGHGRSGNAQDPARSYTLPGLADALLEVLEMIGIYELAIFGWSLGGHIALQMAPQLDGLRGLMITGTPPVSATNIMQGFKPTPHMKLASREHLSPMEIASFGNAIIGTGFTPALYEAISRTDGLMRKTLFETAHANTDVDQRQVAENLSVPLAMVNGAADPVVNLDYIEGLHYANLWQGCCQLLPGLGHAPFWQGPDIFNPILERFLNDISSMPAKPDPVCTAPGRMA